MLKSGHGAFLMPGERDGGVLQVTCHTDKIDAQRPQISESGYWPKDLLDAVRDNNKSFIYSTVLYSRYWLLVPYRMHQLWEPTIHVDDAVQ